MASPWVALPAGTDVSAVARRLTTAREGFLTTGTLDTTLRRLVADSWKRCLERGANPHSGPPVELSDDELEEYRRAHPLAQAMPVIRRLLVDDARDAGFIVALTDATGRLLWVEGASTSRRRAELIGFVEGADWSEGAAGTNAPGTSLALDHPVQIFAAEHLADPVIGWSCSAAPIHAPDGSLLGAIDLTGGNEVAAPHNLTLVRTVAAAVEAELRAGTVRRPGTAPARTSGGPARTSGGPAGGSARSSGAGRAPSGATVARPSAPEGSPVRLRLLGRRTAGLETDAGVTPLRLRHAEILLLLSLHPAGLTSEQLAIELHDRTTAPVTLRAELSRLRDLLSRHEGVELQSRPYRLAGRFDSDIASVRRLLHRGAYRRALAEYPGPLLPDSVAPGVEQARERLRGEVRACLLAGRDAELLWAYAQTPDGAGDLEMWEATGRALSPSSRRMPVVMARVRQLRAEYA